MASIHPVSMIIPLINPHGLCFAGPFEPAFFAEFDSVAIGNEDLLMVMAVNNPHGFHDSASNPFSLISRVNDQVGVINNQISIGNHVAHADQLTICPSRDQSAGMGEGLVEQIRFFRGRSFIEFVDL